jgi:hypothetical protein
VEGRGFPQTVPRRSEEAVRGEAGDLPANLKIAAYEESENHLHFVIPAKPKGAEELSDADLEKVAGGIDVIGMIAVGLLMGATAGMVADKVIKGKQGSEAGWN